jgi:signal transduction histidine kinase
MIPLDLIIVVGAIIGNFILGLLSLLKNPNNITNRLFSLFTMVICFYLGANYLSLHQASPILFLLFVRMVMSLAAFINLLFFLLAYTFPSGKLDLSHTKMALIFLSTAILAGLAQTPLIFETISEETGQPVPGMAIPLFLVHTLFFLGWGLTILIKKALSHGGIERAQSRVFLLGAAIMFALIVFSNVILVVFFNISTFVVFLPLYTFIFDGAVAYAIVRHRFMDLRLAIARSVAYLTVLVVIGWFYAYSFSGIQKLILGDSENVLVLIGSTVLTLIVALSFQSLKSAFEKYSNRIFYKEKYDANAYLQSMSRIMAKTIIIDEMSSLLLNEITSQMKISGAAILLFRDRKIIWIKEKDIKPPRDYDSKKLYPVVHNLVTSKGENILIYDEMPESPTKEILRKDLISIVLPLVVKDNIIGTILLGEKSSGSIFSSSDIELLKILAPEIAVAINNAISYDEIKKFNITLKKEVTDATAHLRRSNEKLKELDHLKDEFVSIASHELRTPMTAIKSYLWLAIDKSKEKVDKQTGEYMTIAYDSTQRLLKLVEEMLTVSRIEGKRINISKGPVDLVDLVKSIYKELEIKAKESAIKLVFKSESSEMIIKGDKTKLRDVFQNIIGNALKFTPKEGLVRTSVTQDKNQVKITIFNSGTFISKDDIEKLFEKFNRIASVHATNSNEHSTGLGLYISKQIIKLHSGKITVESNEKTGTSFVIELPV